MTISIIIPTYNEAAHIGELVAYLHQHGGPAMADLIVSDGGSKDGTLAVAQAAGALAVTSPGKGRAAQMNYGASLAQGDVLYFVHADCYPPPTFVADIRQALASGYDLGRYRTRFDSEKTILRINAWFTRFDFFICMGGDQTLFITRTLFETCGGFKEHMRIMEEYDLCERARKLGTYRILPKPVRVSARKYDTNSWLRVQLANAKVVRMYKRGASQETLVNTYQQMLNYRKNAF